MTRKIIQLTANDYVLYALCDDGTTWYIRGGANKWHPLPPIPQESLEVSVDTSNVA